MLFAEDSRGSIIVSGATPIAQHSEYKRPHPFQLLELILLGHYLLVKKWGIRVKFGCVCLRVVLPELYIKML